jgi:uncharacterized membrane protein YjjP (DUF1212 family)
MSASSAHLETRALYVISTPESEAETETEATADESAASAEAVVEFLAIAARALHGHGAPVHQLEASLVGCAAALGHEAQVFATPTSIDIAVGGRRQHNHLIRAGAGSADLGRLVGFERILLDVREGRLDLDEARAQLEAMSDRAPDWGPRAVVLAFAATSAGAAYFFGGGLADLGLSFVVGLGLGLVSLAAAGRPAFGQLYDAVSAFAATLASLILATLIPGVQAEVVCIAGLVVLLPGLSLTLALSEIATKHLVSGTSRLAGSLSVFACMAVGVGLARAIAAHLGLGGGAAASSASMWFGELPTLVRWSALIVSPIGWAICWQARRADLPAIVVTGVIANEVCRLAGEAMGPEAAAFAGAVVVGLAANAYAQRQAVPRDVILQPCLLLLVPGSMGFRGMTSLMSHDLTAGVDTVFGVAMIASTLVAGVLVANCIPLPKLRPARTETEAQIEARALRLVD